MFVCGQPWRGSYRIIRTRTRLRALAHHFTEVIIHNIKINYNFTNKIPIPKNPGNSELLSEFEKYLIVYKNLRKINRIQRSLSIKS